MKLMQDLIAFENYWNSMVSRYKCYKSAQTFFNMTGPWTNIYYVDCSPFKALISTHKFLQRLREWQLSVLGVNHFPSRFLQILEWNWINVFRRDDVGGIRKDKKLAKMCAEFYIAKSGIWSVVSYQVKCEAEVNIFTRIWFFTALQ